MNQLKYFRTERGIEWDLCVISFWICARTAQQLVGIAQSGQGKENQNSRRVRTLRLELRDSVRSCGLFAHVEIFDVLLDHLVERGLRDEFSHGCHKCLDSTKDPLTLELLGLVVRRSIRCLA